MVRRLFIQVTPHVSTDAQSIDGHQDELKFGAEPFEEHHELELEDDRRILGRSSANFA
jgi:hypothetical protein